MRSFRPVYCNRLLSVRSTIRRFSQSATANDCPETAQDLRLRAVKTSSTLMDRKSKFIGHARYTKTTENVRIYKGIRHTPYPCTLGWRNHRGYQSFEVCAQGISSGNVRLESSGWCKFARRCDDKLLPFIDWNPCTGSADCGEKGAGQALLSLLRTAKLEDVLVVVTRFYGGIPLGNDRFRYALFFHSCPNAE